MAKVIRVPKSHGRATSQQILGKMPRVHGRATTQQILPPQPPEQQMQGVTKEEVPAPAPRRVAFFFAHSKSYEIFLAPRPRKP